MTRIASVSLLLGAAALSACVPPAPEPTPVPSPTPTPVAAPEPQAAPPQVVTPTYDNWMDAPATPGDWSYVSEPGETLAVFGTSRTPEGVSLIIACRRDTGRVSIARSFAPEGQVEMLIRTETQDRTLTASPFSGVTQLAVAELVATDSLLDAMAFSRGRFAVDVAGAEPIFAPAYPEVTRVIEDCRR
ncbi:hypothetical protein [Aurantiacibacter gangjinensis]|uniref:Uncharacterized protein n=1 Tax=Aurantiacibacter gangjinensis TaxID=502682 RepID=A0A0G9MT89_9SPHN|nr:hypothetical protein [Aurantiacibacter gangjinensis]APE28287.1 hypothetical protein BMF35_a1458 [Aurantiacibacter gangjinensis]KLE32528.1 hypothetical protein AAW01_00175 [Aurantiacibacter gangjinensis]